VRARSLAVPSGTPVAGFQHHVFGKEFVIQRTRLKRDAPGISSCMISSLLGAICARLQGDGGSRVRRSLFLYAQRRPNRVADTLVSSAEYEGLEGKHQSLKP
jgi:hypothetical protein